MSAAGYEVRMNAKDIDALAKLVFQVQHTIDGARCPAVEMAEIKAAVGEILDTCGSILKPLQDTLKDLQPLLPHFRDSPSKLLQVALRIRMLSASLQNSTAALNHAISGPTNTEGRIHAQPRFGFTAELTSGNSLPIPGPDQGIAAGIVAEESNRALTLVIERQMVLNATNLDIDAPTMERLENMLKTTEATERATLRLAFGTPASDPTENFGRNTANDSTRKRWWQSKPSYSAALARRGLEVVGPWSESKKRVFRPIDVRYEVPFDIFTSPNANRISLAEGWQQPRLELFYPAYGAAVAAVELIAGLWGHYLKTWQADDGTVWPRDLLPRSISNIRVLSFDYKTTVNGSTSRDEIANNAIFLLELLHFDRETDEAAAARPIIFVGHSLGGLLIKTAITWPTGIQGTPGCGMLSEALHEQLILARLYLGPAAVEHTISSGPAYEEDAQRPRAKHRHSPKVADEFRPLQNELGFANFVEGDEMGESGRRPGLVLVDENHGLMNAPKKKEMVMKGNHLGICKFGRCRGDRNAFAAASEGMEFLIKQSPKAIDQMDRDARRAFHSLCPTGFYDYSAAKERGEGGCEWISEPQELQDWLDDEADKQMLWIQGTGKVVSYCHLGDSVPERGGTCIPVLSRATLYHALRYEPELAYEILVPAFFEAEGNEKMIGHVRDDDIWTAERLAPMWPNALAIVLSFRPPTLVVDGLNQMGIGCQQGFLDCIAACKAKAGPEYMGRLRVLLLPSEGQEKEESQEKPLFRYYIGDT
ncbi:hypothetical protein B0H63DRAFT_529366 [Podospora didyma]|uniref:Nephrocystin 3-like N-terminal domain-containing protein n=1 Tax=Podospora didyma TaxID=330526 RepID=A0AAE0K121_9PEZI|nr:hypothetical protein B0H63DRAFT_529366 [Podospora didyma]